MEDLIRAINATPIIDNHAHPLLVPKAHKKYPLLAITSEASGNALNTTTSSLSHIRATQQLSQVLGCPPTWDDVVRAIDVEKSKPGNVWAKRCLAGIETILIDDGLDGVDEVYGYVWHDGLVQSKCKRIVRIEKVAETIIDGMLKSEGDRDSRLFPVFVKEFRRKIQTAVDDAEVVGFKSVICYRTGLNIPPAVDQDQVELMFSTILKGILDQGLDSFKRIDSEPINAFLVHEAAMIIQNSRSEYKKPLQFHTGLGDNDIMLTNSSPAHLQDFIKAYPKLPIILLHASYPWTKEAGYLASVYDNVYADIGEVFPMLSKDGQLNVVREILELCPTQKVLWSTDGHWFPETYLLATIQIREALEAILPEYVRSGILSVTQAIRAVQDILFTTSNDLYNLKLTLHNQPKTESSSLHIIPSSRNNLASFLEDHSQVKFIRLQYSDYTGILHIRVLPKKKALYLLSKKSALSIGIVKCALGLLPNDTLISNVTASGEYQLIAIMSSLRPGPVSAYASVHCEFREGDGSPVEICPRSVCRRAVESAGSIGLNFLVGFEIEVVFMVLEPVSGKFTVPAEFSRGHSWSNARAFHSPLALKVLDAIHDRLTATGIDLEQFHSESADGQFEFVLPPLPPVESVDMLLNARDTIAAVAAEHGLRATLFPKPFPMQAGTASHVHISLIKSGTGDEVETYESFYAGILEHLQSIVAFTYGSPASYDRMVDGCWAGGTWVCWGTQNKEAALRKVEGSHWEIKTLDGLANAYLAIASIIAAGTHGFAQRKKMVIGDCEIDPSNLNAKKRKALNITSKLPANLNEALDILDKNEELRALLGDAVVDRHIDMRRADMNLLDGMSPEERREWLIGRY